LSSHATDGISGAVHKYSPNQPEDKAKEFIVANYESLVVEILPIGQYLRIK
jgi:hypothetical protein